MRTLLLGFVVVAVPVAFLGAGAALSIACAGGESTGGEGEGEGEGDTVDDAPVSEEPAGGADEASAVDVDGSTLPFALFGTKGADGHFAGLSGFYLVSGLTPSAAVVIHLQHENGDGLGCPSTSSIDLTGQDSAELFGGLNGVDCPEATVHVDSAGHIVVNWQGDSPVDYGLVFHE